jgi:hypothetical protein
MNSPGGSLPTSSSSLSTHLLSRRLLSLRIAHAHDHQRPKEEEPGFTYTTRKIGMLWLVAMQAVGSSTTALLLVAAPSPSLPPRKGGGGGSGMPPGVVMRPLTSAVYMYDVCPRRQALALFLASGLVLITPCATIENLFLVPVSHGIRDLDARDLASQLPRYPRASGFRRQKRAQKGILNPHYLYLSERHSIAH